MSDVLKPRYPVGVSILVVDRRGRIALGERATGMKAAGLLSTPGGRIEYHEDLFDAAARELREETGVEKLSTQFRLLAFREHRRYGEHYFMAYLAVRYDGPLENREPSKSGPWEWYKPLEVPPERTTEPPDILAIINEVPGLNRYAREAHAANERWWRDPSTGEPVERNFGELIALVHSELSEALEGHRKNLMDDKLPARRMVEVELADALIRIFDIAGAYGYDLEGAYREKTKYNAERADHKPENRTRPGGKAY